MSMIKKALHPPVIYIFIFAALLFSFYWNSTIDKVRNEVGYSVQEYGDIDREAQEFCKDTKQEKTEITGKRRVNILLLGIESNERADTIMFLSYDSVKGKLSIVSIPRDTYFFEAGYSKGDQRKINAVFGRKKEEGCTAAVSKLLCDTPVDFYMSIDYKGLEKIIDTIGGVELTAPLDMEVGGIEIPQGEQVLNGYEALQFVRYRKGYVNGDLGRIEMQQKLIEAVLDKVQLNDLPRILSKSFGSVNTNMPFELIKEYSFHYKSLEIKDVSGYILPGIAMYKHIDGYNWSYFFHNPKEVRKLIDEIYGKTEIELEKRKRNE